MIVSCDYLKGGPRTVGEDSFSGSVVDAAELPPVSEVAEGSGKGIRGNHKAQS